MIVGIPTRDRPARAAALADRIAQEDAVSSVIVVYRGAEPRPSSPKAITFGGPEVTLQDARNHLLRSACGGSSVASFQIDDDIDPVDLTIALARMADSLEKYPWLGAVGTCPKFYWGMGAKNDRSDTGFMLVSAAFQFWAIRCEAFAECGPMDLETAEDLEYGYRLWSHGWAVGRLTGWDGVHDVRVPRLNKTAAAGGQPVEEREAFLPGSFAVIRERYPELVKLGETKGVKRKATHFQRPQWPALLARLRNRWGTVGYTDSKGRRA